jgi:uncharacterized protein YbgA (DUF1722 family)/uncharacterized protein YbbK (DUF523 family)
MLVNEKIKLGVSRCLLGDRVRYDGMHKRDSFIVDTLGKYVEFVAVCPEVECGLPVPREAMRLVGSVESPRLMTQKTGIDHTDRMMAWASKRLEALAGEGLCGFIFKAKSPSSGMERVKVYNGRGGLSGRAPGMFAKEFMKRFPLLPVEDEGRLYDPDLRENFIERIFALKRYRDAVSEGISRKALMDFHASHKLLIMSHNAKAVSDMGRMIAGGKGRITKEETGGYEAMLLQVLQIHSTVPRHVNVLQHMIGYFTDKLDGQERKELLGVIDDYRKEYVPLVVPLTLIRHYVSKYNVDYLLGQCYLNPHPLEMKLRNHA